MRPATPSSLSDGAEARRGIVVKRRKKMRSSSKIPLGRGHGPDDEVAGRANDLSPLIPQFVAVLPLIPQILTTVDDIRSHLHRLRKSHYTVEEIAEATARSCYTVRQWIKQKRIGAIRVPGTGPKGRLLIPREELEKLVATGLASQLPAAAID
jgi:excisionase family DNA binding protein